MMKYFFEDLNYVSYLVFHWSNRLAAHSLHDVHSNSYPLRKFKIYQSGAKVNTWKFIYEWKINTKLPIGLFYTVVQFDSAPIT